MKKRKKVLVAPLDWGLGHATRCIPVINELLARDADVVIAADNRPLDLLKKEFPSLEHLHFPGHVVRYHREGNLHGTIAEQIPSILAGFRKEHHYLNVIVKLHSIDAVISDSRFGSYSRSVPSVLLIHQLNILLPSYLSFGKGIVASVNRALCNRYSEVWIPDFQNEPTLAGAMSHPEKMPKNSHYVGPLSRMVPSEAAKEIDILVILSGPEPQRTVFEEIVVRQLKTSGRIAVIVRGKPEHTTTMKVAPNITMINSLHTPDLTRMIASARLILSRPGYSTVMDLSFAGANAIFVPTPQQTEQEYLARMLKEKKICYSEEQKDFDLRRSIDRSEAFSGFTKITNDLSVLRARIDHLIGT